MNSTKFDRYMMIFLLGIISFSVSPLNSWFEMASMVFAITYFFSIFLMALKEIIKIIGDFIERKKMGKREKEGT